jgi:hypothetical protein
LQHKCTTIATSSIYFCKICIKHLQHTSETSETLETYTCIMCFQCNISLLLRRMEARRRAGGSDPATLVGGGGSTMRWGGNGRTVGRGQLHAASSCRSAWPGVVLEIQQVAWPTASNTQRKEAEEVEQLLREHQLRVAHPCRLRLGQRLSRFAGFPWLVVPLGLWRWWAMSLEQIGMGGQEDKSDGTRRLF